MVAFDCLYHRMLWTCILSHRSHVDGQHFNGRRRYGWNRRESVPSASLLDWHQVARESLREPGVLAQPALYPGQGWCTVGMQEISGFCPASSGARGDKELPATRAWRLGSEQSEVCVQRSCNGRILRLRKENCGALNSRLLARRDPGGAGCLFFKSERIPDERRRNHSI